MVSLREKVVQPKPDQLLAMYVKLTYQVYSFSAVSSQVMLTNQHDHDPGFTELHANKARICTNHSEPLK